MQVELIGQAREVFAGRAEPGPSWEMLWLDAWQTLEHIRAGRLPAAHGRSVVGEPVFQYARDACSRTFAVKVAPDGRVAIFMGELLAANWVRYHRFALYPP